jgi:hypothetical protein
MSKDVTSTEARKLLTQKLAKALGNKRFCTTCQTDQPDSGGTTTKYRWICKFCAARRTVR